MSATVRLEDEYLEAAEALRRIAAERKLLAEAEAKAKAVIARLLAAGDTGVSPDGEPLVRVQAGARRFDAATATANLPADLLERITVPTPDGKRAKEILAPALWELCTKQNAPSVVVV